MNPIIAGSIIANALRRKRKFVRRPNGKIEEEEEEDELIYRSINRETIQSIIDVQDIEKSHSFNEYMLAELKKYLDQIPTKQTLMPGHMKHVFDVMAKLLNALDFQVFHEMVKKMSK